MTDHIRDHRNNDLGLAEIVGWSAPSGLAVPAYGVVKITSFASGIFSTSKPDGEEGLFYVNGPVATATDGYGSSIMWIRAQPVLFETGASVSIGDTCGPIEDEWYMAADGTGWRIFAEPDANNIAFVVKDGGGGGGAGYHIGFEITEADCTAGTVTTVDSSIFRFTGCGTPPGADDYGDYTIYDYYGYLSDLEDADMVDQKAFAIYWYPHPGCTPRWDLLMVDYGGDCP